MNALSSSEEVCKQVVEDGLHTDILSTLKSDTLNAETLNDPQSSAKKTVVQQQVSILHNVVRRAQSARPAFRQHKAVDFMQKFRNVNEP